MEQVGRKRDIGGARNGPRFSVVYRLNFRDLIGVFEKQVADAPEYFTALAGSHTTPGTGLESATGGGNRAVNRFAVAVGDVCDHGAIGGIEDFEGFAGGRGDPLAIYEIMPGFAEPCCDGSADPRDRCGGAVAVAISVASMDAGLSLWCLAIG